MEGTEKAEEGTGGGGKLSLTLHLLPEELLVKVFVRVKHPPLIACCTRLNKRFHAVLSDDSLWKDIVAAATDGKQPPRNGISLGLAGPEDSYRYRHAYVRLMYDVSRLEISAEELIHSTWNFYFVNDLYLFHASPEQAAQRAGAAGNPGYTAEFSEKGFFTSNIAGAPSRRTPTRWQLLARSEIELNVAADTSPSARDASGSASQPAHGAGVDFASPTSRAQAVSRTGRAAVSASDDEDPPPDARREYCAEAAERRRQEEDVLIIGDAGQDVLPPPAVRARGPLSPPGFPLAHPVRRECKSRAVVLHARRIRRRV